MEYFLFSEGRFPFGLDARCFFSFSWLPLGADADWSLFRIDLDVASVLSRTELSLPATNEVEIFVSQSLSS